MLSVHDMGQERVLVSREFNVRDKIEKNEMGWACGRFGEEESLVGRPEGKKPLETYRRRWEDNIPKVLQ
jgi:hypothetical protein